MSETLALRIDRERMGALADVIEAWTREHPAVREVRDVEDLVRTALGAPGEMQALRACEFGPLALKEGSESADRPAGAGQDGQDAPGQHASPEYAELCERTRPQHAGTGRPGLPSAGARDLVASGAASARR